MILILIRIIVGSLIGFKAQEIMPKTEQFHVQNILSNGTLSIILSYITYCQVWIIQKNQQLFIGGTTNRALFDFELEFLKSIKENY